MTKENEILGVFWLGASASFSQQLIIIPPKGAPDCQYVVTIFDCDGSEVNNLEITPRSGEVLTLPVSSLVALNKLESGIRYGLGIIERRAEVAELPHNVYLRLLSSNVASFMDRLVPVTNIQTTFFPFTFAEDLAQFVCVSNLSQDSAILKGRVFIKNRMPEFSVDLAPRGSAFIDLKRIVEPFVGSDNDVTLQGHVRFTLKRGQRVGVQLLEFSQTSADFEVYSAVA